MPIAQAVVAAPRRIAASTGIAQDNIIFAAVMFAFVVWITTKGELPTYLKFFTPGASQGPITSPVTATPSTGATSNPVSTALGGVPSQVGNLVSGNWGTAIYNAVIGTPLKAIQGVGKSLGLPGF